MTQKSRTLLGELRQQRSRLIQEAMEAAESGNLQRKWDKQMRIRFLTKLRQLAEERKVPIDKPSVFISYSKNTGQTYFEVAAKLGREEFGVDIVTGFDSQTGEFVLTEVLKAISKSLLFLSIMTPEYRIETGISGGKSFMAPSVWLMEEKGMALAMHKPFRLLVETTVHPDFWLRTAPNNLHTVFDGSNFVERAGAAFQALMMRYDDMLVRSVTLEERHVAY
jgi:hypothetical protein